MIAIRKAASVDDQGFRSQASDFRPVSERRLPSRSQQSAQKIADRDPEARAEQRRQNDHRGWLIFVPSVVGASLSVRAPVIQRHGNIPPCQLSRKLRSMEWRMGLSR